MVAVNELLTNAVRHGGGTGHVALWCVDGSVWCEVTDRGDGLAAPAPERPAPDELGGRGLWLVRQLIDTIDITSGPEGTAVRISSLTSGKS